MLGYLHQQYTQNISNGFGKVKGRDQMIHKINEFTKLDDDFLYCFHTRLSTKKILCSVWGDITYLFLFDDDGL